MNQFSEDNLVEQTVIKLIKEVWVDPACHINAYTDENDLLLGRDNQGEVVLKKYLLPALQKLNPGLTEEALTQAIDTLTRDRSNLGLVKTNQEVYKLLRDGINVSVAKENGEAETERIQFFDFENPENNHFLCVSQLWVVGEMYTKRPDVVLFVNGIPLILLELKASHKSLVDAHRDNIRDYKDTIPKLFWYNMGIIISNGIENKFGSLTSPYEFFNEWKKTGSEEDTPKTDLGTIITGVCDKTRLLDIFENFILFDESKSEVRKIVPRYFQYLGVNRAFENITNRKELEGKLGVFWHTQGSGKSYSMVWLSQKTLRKLTGNFTFVIVTDRTQMVKKNKKRAKFMERLVSLLQEYNSGAHDIDQLFDDLVELAKDLSVEEQRAVKENLSEEELAVFDLLVKENLNPEEVAIIKGTSHELLTNLKPLLVPHWRDFEQNRAGVKIAISDLLFAKLPEPTYTEQECELKGFEVYNFVYEHYQNAISSASV